MIVELVNNKNEVIETTNLLEETFKNILIKMSTRVLGKPKILVAVKDDYKYYNFGSKKLYYRIRISKD